MATGVEGGATASGFDLAGNETGDGPPKPAAFGSGLFTDEDEEGTDYRPAFSESDDDAETDRGWSYDDPDEESEDESADYAPAFASPEPDGEDLAVAGAGGGLKRLFAWRPSMPEFSGGSIGASGIGMWARDALSMLDALVEENGTEDIPRGLLSGLGVFAAFLGLVAVLIAIF